MPIPMSSIIAEIPGYEIEKIEGRNPVKIYAKYTGKTKCPYCKNRHLRIKATFIRKLRHESIGLRITYLCLEAHKYHCPICGKYFNSIFPGILKHKRSTEGFRREVFEKHNNGICQKTLSRDLQIGTATVERWYHDFLELKVREMKDRFCPQVMGIDEHFFTKKKGYLTTICDLREHRVFDVVIGRTENTLGEYLNQLNGKENVKVVVMDLAETYRSIIKKHFPNAKIVTDRFHVIKLINHHFLKLWQEIDPIGRKNRGLLSLMRRHKENLKPEQILKLEEYFKQYPAMKVIYDFKQKLCRLMLIKHQTKRECRKHIPVFLNYINQLKTSLFDPMVTLGKTFESWSEELVRMWRFTKNNGITEGFHTKMEMINRRAYGFRNFENYRLRVRALCC